MKLKFINILLILLFFSNITLQEAAFSLPLENGTLMQDLSTPSMLDDLVGLQHKDMGRIKFGLKIHLMSISKNKPVFHPADIQFFFREAVKVEEGYRVMSRIKDKDGPRTYFLVLSQHPNDGGEVETKGIFTQKEYNDTGELTGILPQRKPADARVINKHVQDEEEKYSATRYTHEDDGLVVKEDTLEAARWTARKIVDEVNTNPDAVLGFATGGTQLPVYQEVIRLTIEEGVDWSGITTFNLDEYVGIAEDHPESYRNFMNVNLFNPLIPFGLDIKNTHVPNANSDDPVEEMRSYVSKIRKKGGVDLWLLGIGSDGHYAFLEPAIIIGKEFQELLEGNALEYQDSILPPVRKIRDFNEFVIYEDKLRDYEGIRSVAKKILRLQAETRRNLDIYEDIIKRRMEKATRSGKYITPEEAKKQVKKLGERMLRESEITFYVDLPEDQRGQLEEELYEVNHNVKVLEISEYFSSSAKVVSIALPTIVDNSRFFNNVNEVPLKALTATGIVRESNRLIQIATGEGKARALKATLQSAPSPEIPSTILTKHLSFTVIADRDAVSMVDMATFDDVGNSVITGLTREQEIAVRSGLLNSGAVKYFEERSMVEVVSDNIRALVNMFEEPGLTDAMTIAIRSALVNRSLKEYLGQMYIFYNSAKIKKILLWSREISLDLKIMINSALLHGAIPEYSGTPYVTAHRQSLERILAGNELTRDQDIAMQDAFLSEVVVRHLIHKFNEGNRRLSILLLQSMLKEPDITLEQEIAVRSALLHKMATEVLGEEITAENIRILQGILDGSYERRSQTSEVTSPSDSTLDDDAEFPERDDSGQFIEKPGKSPLDAMIVISLSEDIRDLITERGWFTLRDYLKAYKDVGEQLGFEPLAINPESTARRDLHRSKKSLVSQDLLEIVEDSGYGIKPYRYRLTDKGVSELVSINSDYNSAQRPDLITAKRFYDEKEKIKKGFKKHYSYPSAPFTVEAQLYFLGVNMLEDSRKKSRIPVTDPEYYTIVLASRLFYEKDYRPLHLDFEKLRAGQERLRQELLLSDDFIQLYIISSIISVDPTLEYGEDGHEAYKDRMQAIYQHLFGSDDSYRDTMLPLVFVRFQAWDIVEEFADHLRGIGNYEGALSLLASLRDDISNYLDARYDLEIDLENRGLHTGRLALMEELEKDISAEMNVTENISIAVEAGRQIPTHLNNRYTLLVDNALYGHGDLENDIRGYDTSDEDKHIGAADRFNLHAVDTSNVTNILAHIEDPERTIVQLADELSEEDLKILKDSAPGIRVIRVDASFLDVEFLNDDGVDISKEIYKDMRRDARFDLYAMMLMARKVQENDILEGSTIYELLRFFINSHYDDSDEDIAGMYIEALVAGDISFIVDKVLYLQPAERWDIEGYSLIGATLISA